MRIIQGSILSLPTEDSNYYILQQCNCTTLYPLGLSKSIEEKFGVCPYRKRKRLLKARNTARLEDRDIPGTISIDEVNSSLSIINLFGQYGPGGKAFDGPYKDDAKSREGYFESGLLKIIEYFTKSINKNVVKIAVPYNIGCGLAKGKWENYLKMLMDFETKLEKLNIELIMYKL